MGPHSKNGNRALLYYTCLQVLGVTENITSMLSYIVSSFIHPAIFQEWVTAAHHWLFLGAGGRLSQLMRPVLEIMLVTIMYSI